MSEFDTLLNLLNSREDLTEQVRDVQSDIVEEINNLVKAGHSYREIGAKMGVTGQRVHQLSKVANA